MADFVRARTDEQKERRLAEIKDAADAMFSEGPYHDITLTAIAQRLGCSRAQVYKYVSTREEVFLEISADKRDAYFDALLAAFPEGCGYPPEVFAEVWAGILNAHRDFLRYCDILMTIVETNVSVERLARFKSEYYGGLDRIVAMLSSNLGIGEADASKLYYRVYYQAVGMGAFCQDNPLVEEAVRMAGREAPKPDFRSEMRDFILMCILDAADRRWVHSRTGFPPHDGHRMRCPGVMT